MYYVLFSNIICFQNLSTQVSWSVNNAISLFPALSFCNNIYPTRNEDIADSFIIWPWPLYELNSLLGVSESSTFV